MGETVTIAEISEKLGIEREAADGLVKFLLALGEVEDVGVRVAPRGRSPRAYVLKPGAAEAVARAVRKLPR